MKDHLITNPFESIFNYLEFLKGEMAEIKSKLDSTSTTEKKYYSIADAARKLNVAQITMYRNVQAGKVPSKKVGSRLMVPGSFVDR